jgi:hypothetical protein
MADKSLIDQALAAMAARGPVKFGEPSELPFDQILISSVYDAVRAKRRGHGSDKEIDRSHLARHRAEQDGQATVSPTPGRWAAR